MSISVDDLVASLSSSHIGQEQMDLAALQAQLSQVLFHQPLATSPSMTSYRHGACTPVSRTPTHSGSWDRTNFERGRSNSVASTSGRGNYGEHQYETGDAMEDDERMVEDLLFPSSPVASSATPAQSPFGQAPPASPTHYPMHARKSSLSAPFSPLHYDNPPPNSSLFATTDPFYLSQLQAAQNVSPSFFSHYAKPSQQSPFLRAHQFQPTHGHVFAHHPEAQSASAFVR